MDASRIRQSYDTVGYGMYHGGKMCGEQKFFVSESLLTFVDRISTPPAS